MKANKNEKLGIIRRLVGKVTSEQLRYVDSFVSSANLLPMLKRFMIEADNKIAGSDAVLHA